MKTAAEVIITAALLRRFNAPAFCKAAADLPTPGIDWAQKAKDVLSNPVAQYGLAGAGVGGIGSALRSMFGKPDEDIEGGAVERFLRSTALGGLAGAGLAGGAQMLGAKLPTLPQLRDKAVDIVKPTPLEQRPRIRPDWSTSAGVAGLGALAAGSGAWGLRHINRNHALSAAVKRLLKPEGDLTKWLPAGVAAEVTKGGPAKGILGKIRSGAGRAVGEGPELRRLRGVLDREQANIVAGKPSDVDVQEIRELLREQATRGLPESLITPRPWPWAGAGAATAGLLHQGLGSQPDA